MSRPTSPTRLVRKALRAASEFGFSSHQWPMSTNEQTPTSSQPTIICSVFSREHEEQHRRGEQAEEGEVVGVAAVAGDVVGGVDVDQQRDERDDERASTALSPSTRVPTVDRDAAGLEPGDAGGPPAAVTCVSSSPFGRLRRLGWWPCACASAARRWPTASGLGDLPGAFSAELTRWIQPDADARRDRTKQMASAAMPISEPPWGSRLPKPRIEDERQRGDERDDPGVGEHGSGAQPFMRSTSSRSTLLRLRKMASTMARPTPTSAAATAMTNRANTWPDDRAVHGAERDEVDVDGVEDQLDRHEHHDAVAAGDHAVDADAEQDGGQQEELVQEHRRSVPPGDDDGPDQRGQQEQRTRPRTGAGRSRRSSR